MESRTTKVTTASQPPVEQSDGDDQVSRRKALGRMAAYTAPVMVALLISEQAAAVSQEGL
jgi:hypothetical protein